MRVQKLKARERSVKPFLQPPVSATRGEISCLRRLRTDRPGHPRASLWSQRPADWSPSGADMGLGSKLWSEWVALGTLRFP